MLLEEVFAFVDPLIASERLKATWNPNSKTWE